MSRSQQAATIISKYSAKVQKEVYESFKFRLKIGSHITKEGLEWSAMMAFNSYGTFSSLGFADKSATYFAEKYRCYEELLTLF